MGRLRPRLGCILSPSTLLSSLYLFQSKFGDSMRTVTWRADIVSGDSYMHSSPPCMETGPDSPSFRCSPSTASASALVTSVQASNSLDAEAAGFAAPL